MNRSDRKEMELIVRERLNRVLNHYGEVAAKIENSFSKLDAAREVIKEKDIKKVLDRYNTLVPEMNSLANELSDLGISIGVNDREIIDAKWIGRSSDHRYWKAIEGAKEKYLSSNAKYVAAKREIDRLNKIKSRLNEELYLADATEDIKKLLDKIGDV